MKHVVITGAADGIGRALAFRFGQAGYTITNLDVDVARAAETTQALAARGVEAYFIQTDLSDAASRAVAMQALAQRPLVDVFIHNAGISAAGKFEALALAPQLKVVDVNLLAPLELTRALLADERLAPAASLVFIASLSVYAGYPGAAVYGASKDGIAAYARSLRAAFKPQGIHVLTVYPGPTRTAHARRYSPDNSREHRRMAPEELAELIFTSVQRRKTQLIPGAGNALFALLGKLFPALTEQLLKKTLFNKMT
ncbi:MAG: SDR family NAD(P)-dependent oxidoreductase [Chloroflexi bacterium]|nr:SDR family NAD(P)-dependent oxidoreductase [Chloroflexota bacterium]